MPLPGGLCPVFTRLMPGFFMRCAAMTIHLYSRVRLADGRYGTVISRDPEAGFFTIELPNGQREYTKGAGLTPMPDLNKWDQVDRQLKVEMDDSMKTINNVCYRS